MVTTAVYRNSVAYNIASSNTDFQGTDFGTKVFDGIGLVHNYDETNYKHTFTVPDDGVYLIHAFMNFQGGASNQQVLYGRLDVNDVEQSRQSKFIGSYAGADFIFLNEMHSGDKMCFTVLQNSGNTIQTAGGCRLNIIRIRN